MTMMRTWTCHVSSVVVWVEMESSTTWSRWETLSMVGALFVLNANRITPAALVRLSRSSELLGLGSFTLKYPWHSCVPPIACKRSICTSLCAIVCTACASASACACCAGGALCLCKAGGGKLGGWLGGAVRVLCPLCLCIFWVVAFGSNCVGLPPLSFPSGCNGYILFQASTPCNPARWALDSACLPAVALLATAAGCRLGPVALLLATAAPRPLLGFGPLALRPQP